MPYKFLLDFQRIMEEIEENLRSELRKEMEVEKVNWMEAAEAKWKYQAKGKEQKLREDLCGKFEEE